MCAMSTRPRSPSTADDLFGVLERDHHAIRDVLARGLEQLDDDPDAARSLVEEARAQLIAHARAEERSLYLALEHDPATGDLALDAREQHGVIEGLLEELEHADQPVATYKAKLRVMIDILAHHLEQEEHVLFPRARAVLGSRVALVTEEFLAEKGRVLARLIGDDDDDLFDDDDDDDGGRVRRGLD